MVNLANILKPSKDCCHDDQANCLKSLYLYLLIIDPMHMFLYFVEVSNMHLGIVHSG